jgi:hypothetical protein
VIPVIHDARHDEAALVLGEMRKPASRSSGSASSAIAGRFVRSSSASVLRSRDTLTPGVGGAFRICGIGAGGVR